MTYPSCSATLPQPSIPANDVKAVVEQVRKYIDENYRERITLDGLARMAFYSKFHLTRVFTRHVGVSPGRYLRFRRLAQAMYLLRTTNLEVTQITVDVGYTSIGTFSSTFSEELHMSPTVYRLRMQRRAAMAYWEKALRRCA